MGEGEGKRGNRRSVGRSIGLASVCACRMTVVVVKEREGENGSSLRGHPFMTSALRGEGGRGKADKVKEVA